MNNLSGLLSNGHNLVGATDVRTHLARNNVLVNSLRTVARMPLWLLALLLVLVYFPAGINDEKK